MNTVVLCVCTMPTECSCFKATTKAGQSVSIIKHIADHLSVAHQ